MSNETIKIQESLNAGASILVYRNNDPRVLTAYGYNTFNSGQYPTLDIVQGNTAYNHNAILCSFYDEYGKECKDVFNINELKPIP